MSTTPVKRAIPVLRWLLTAGALFMLLAGIQLIGFVHHTDVDFAWTVKPPVSATALGSFFLGATLVAWLSARERTWVRLRGVMLAAIAFSSLTLAATMIHIDRFHLTLAPGQTVFLTYVWIAIFVVGAPALLGLYVLQARMPGADWGRGESLPGPFRFLLGLQSAIALGVGAALFVAPDSLIPMWGWELTPLSARALGAWLIALGILSIQAISENEWERVRPAMIGIFVTALLQVVLFAVFYDLPLLESPGAMAWMGGWLLVLILGGYGAVESTRASIEAVGRRSAAQLG